MPHTAVTFDAITNQQGRLTFNNNQIIVNPLEIDSGFTGSTQVESKAISIHNNFTGRLPLAFNLAGNAFYVYAPRVSHPTVTVKVTVLDVDSEIISRQHPSINFKRNINKIMGDTDSAGFIHASNLSRLNISQNYMTILADNLGSVQPFSIQNDSSLNSADISITNNSIALLSSNQTAMKINTSNISPLINSSATVFNNTFIYKITNAGTTPSSSLLFFASHSSADRQIFNFMNNLVEYQDTTGAGGNALLAFHDVSVTLIKNAFATNLSTNFVHLDTGDLSLTDYEISLGYTDTPNLQKTDVLNFGVELIENGQRGFLYNILDSSSPLVDVENAMLTSSGSDLFNLNRNLDGDGDGIASIDIGAIEFIPPSDEITAGSPSSFSESIPSSSATSAFP